MTATSPAGAARAPSPWLALLPLVLAVLANAPALTGDLIWDDRILLDDQLVRIAGLRDAFLPPTGIPNWALDYYRPLVVLTYLLDFRWLGSPASVLLPHLTNILLHMVATAGVLGLARRVFADRAEGPWLALGAAALFAVHPIHAESVDWIAGRSDVLATALLLPALVLGLRWRDGGRSLDLAGAALLFFLALLAKEVAIAGVVLLPLALYLVPGPAPAGGASLAAAPGTARSPVPAVAAFVLSAGVYLFLRQSAGIVYGQPLDLGPVVAVLGLARVFAWYLVKLVIPWPQTNLVAWGALPGPLLSLAIVLAALLATGLAARRFRAARAGMPLFALLFIAVTLLPSAWIALTPGTRGPVAERYLYLPSVGAVLGLAWIAPEILGPLSRRALLAVVAAVLVAFGAGSVARAFVWNSDVGLWTDATAKSPGDVFAWHSLARALRAAGDADRALATYERALDADPQDYPERAKVWYGMGELYLEQGRLADAGRAFDSAGREWEGFLRPRLGSGIVALLEAQRPGTAPADRQRLLARAVVELRALREQDPTLHEARIVLAEALFEQAEDDARAGRQAEAVGRLRTARAELDAVEIALAPDELAATLATAETGINRNPAQLKARIDAALRAAAP